MIIFCPKDGGPGQLICPRGGVWKNCHPPPPLEDFFLEQPLAKFVCALFGKPNFDSVDDARHFMLKVKCDGKSVNRP